MSPQDKQILLLIQNAVDNGDYEKAGKILKSVIDTANNPAKILDSITTHETDQDALDFAKALADEKAKLLSSNEEPDEQHPEARTESTTEHLSAKK